MANQTYMDGRKKYQRPQGMLWSENPGTEDSGLYIPEGYEIGQTTSETNPYLVNQFIVLSDDNRDPIEFKVDRIEKRERMINGRMRSYHIADKLNISTSWKMLPSRAFSQNPEFDSNGKPTDMASDGQAVPSNLVGIAYTTDFGAGGADILEWYENHKGPFWVFLAYDKYKNFGDDNEAYANLAKYNQAVEMYIADFSYSVERRGGTNYDFWNISVTLEEV